MYFKEVTLKLVIELTYKTGAVVRDAFTMNLSPRLTWIEILRTIKSFDFSGSVDGEITAVTIDGYRVDLKKTSGVQV